MTNHPSIPLSRYTCLCCGGVQSFVELPLTRDKDAEISAGAMAATCRRQALPLYQTDFAFLPV